ncbi:phage terminase small subunit P27 family [Plesiomonas shigelloides]|uniref:phage terminase small subunit P27 family n=1 Tax=Plesiomonas shigelloides TaxID=703 RepID=UPI00143EF2C5|nr:phage terminase small subunit P27 family [Plesiomonas shigelloides]QIY09460.1 phage terminase small subunit P27 family [Plesiomonas shigelloides]
MAGVPGRSGRRLNPAALNDLAGNPGKRKRRSPSPSETFAPLMGVDAPEHLPEMAKIMWETLAPELCSKGVLCLTDLHNLEAFCLAYQTMRQARAHVDIHGVVVAGSQGGPIKNPALTAMNEAMRQMATFGGMLGLDPSSRQRVIGAVGKKENKNPFASL